MKAPVLKHVPIHAKGLVVRFVQTHVRERAKAVSRVPTAVKVHVILHAM